MNIDWGQVLAILLGSILASGGVGVAFLQARASRAVGVRAADVEADKSAGQLALDVAVHVSTRMEAQDRKIDELEAENEERRSENEQRRVEVAALRGELVNVLEEVEGIARDLRRLILWEESGAHGTAPVRLATLYERLAALSNRKKDTNHG